MIETVPRHIEVTPGIRSGKPRIAGTRICVSDVVLWTEQGRSSYEIVADFPQLTLADVYAALAYYYDHQAEIDRQIKDSDDYVAALQAGHAARAE